MNYNYDNFVSYNDFQNMTKSEVSRLMFIVEKERNNVMTNHSHYFSSSYIFDFEQTINFIYEKTYRRDFYYANELPLAKAFIITNIAYQSSNNFIMILNKKFSRETLISLIDLIDYVKDKNNEKLYPQKYQFYKEKCDKYITTIISYFIKYSGHLPAELIINEISRVIAFESDKLVSKKEVKLGKSSENELQSTYPINQLIGKSLADTTDTVLAFTTCYKENKTTIINCTYVQKSNNIMQSNCLNNLITSAEAIKNIAAKQGINFSYCITSIKDFENSDEETLQQIANSTLISCNDAKYFKYFNSMTSSCKKLNKRN